MELTTQRLHIRFLEESDWKSLIEIWDDFGRSDYARYDAPHPTDEAEVRENAKRWAEASPEREHMFFAVCLEGEMIGCVDFHREPAGYECGYCFHSRAHGKGYAKESLQALINWLSGGEKTRFTAGTALDNLPSVRLLESLGFEKVGEGPMSFYKDRDGNSIFFIGGNFVLEST